MDTKQDHLLAAIGNANVDITVRLKDDSLFRKYDLQFDQSKPVDEKVLKAIEEDFKKLDPEIRYSPGGCSQNTLRVFQWLMNSCFNSTIIGSVGNDEHGTFLKNELQNQGVLTSYTVIPDYRTAFVFIFIYKDYITPVYGTSSLASWFYRVSHLLADSIAVESLKKSKVALLEGFFVVHSDDVGREAIDICTKNNTLTSFNICGQYVPKKYPSIVTHYIKSCHIVIGSRAEFKAVCELFDIPTDDFEKALQELFKIMMEEYTPLNSSVKSMEEYMKILIVTGGSKPVYCICGNNKVIKFEVPPVEEHLIKDVTGAGDSFLAGFLYGIINDFPLLKCLELACKVAAEILQQHGCQVPAKNSSSLLDSLS